MKIFLFLLYALTSIIIIIWSPFGISFSYLSLLILNLVFTGLFIYQFIILLRQKGHLITELIIVLLLTFTFPIAILKINFIYYNELGHLLLLLILCGCIIYHTIKKKPSIKSVLPAMLFALSSIVLYFINDGFFFKTWNNDKVYYGKHNFSWDAYKGLAPESAKMNVFTKTIIGWKINKAGNSTRAIFIAYMDPEKSWVKPEVKSDYLLKHEENKLIINDIIAFQLKHSMINYRKNLKRYRTSLVFSRRSAKEEKFVKPSSEHMQTYFMDFIIKKDVLIGQYEFETDNGIDTAQQETWNKVIEKLYKENFF